MNAPEISVYQASLNEPNDQKSISELLNKLRTEGLERYGRDQPLLTSEVSGVAAFFSNSEFGCRIFLAKKANQNVAIAICQTTMSSWRFLRVLNIHDLFVLPGFRGNGIGSRLLDLIESTACKDGFGSVSLETNLANSGAIRLYLNRGYRCTSSGIHTLLERPPIELADRFPDLTISLGLEM